jgi:CheY-like chemotaxis protein
MLGMISDAASRGMGVTRRLLAFARRSELSAGPINPSALLEGLLPMLHSTLGPMVTLSVDAPPTVPMLLADQAQLETVLVNLVNNARDALPASGGRITLTAATAKPVPPSLPDGRYIRLSVVDTGVGMRSDILARVTEPFFTTKGPGKGTGLGLAMARGFAEQSGGLLTIDSEMGRGTTVSLWLPVAANATAEPTSQPAAERKVCNGPNVLLVDDDPTVRAVLSSILDDEGYTVSEASDASAALSLLDTGLEADVLVTDLSMPGTLDGLGLVHAVRERYTDMPAVLITGHIEESGFQHMKESVGPGPFTVLRKPVSARVLCATMEDLLAAATAPSL